jgi:tRNA (cmo5U34)-methyltransferase
VTNQDPEIVFNQEMAAAYDTRNAVFAPLRDSLNFIIRGILAELPTDARILCVGVGTGVELVDLAQAFPQWQFTAVDPAAPMLEICRQRVEEFNLTSRCTFHQGYLDSLPTTDRFDAATCLFVSHFLVKSEDRSNFFHQIALRLRPQGYVINADIAYDRSAAAYPELLDAWLRIMKSTGSTEDDENYRERVRTAYSHNLAVLPPSEVASMIAGGGFDAPVLFFQNLLMHAWYAKRGSID